MSERKNAALLSDDERDAFLEALIRLKHRPAPGAPPGVSRYDQFVATHAAVMAVRVPDWPDLVNLGHWNAGFLPWHRKFLHLFEQALQAEVPEAALPYWHWPDHEAALTRVFADDFMGPIRAIPTMQVGVFRLHVPVGDRPQWWPTDAEGFPLRIRRTIGEGALHRRNPLTDWPSSAASLTLLQTYTGSPRLGVHPYWIFWQGVEAGISWEGWPSRTHNSGHNVVGGAMSDPMFSPNDPMFWLHHANVDRIWAVWQQNMLATNEGVHADHYPPQSDVNPWDGRAVPPGHRIDDEMWPWVSTPAAYAVESFLQMPHRDFLEASLLPAGQDVVTPRAVLDTTNLGYTYAQPGP